MKKYVLDIVVRVSRFLLNVVICFLLNAPGMSFLTRGHCVVKIYDSCTDKRHDDENSVVIFEDFVRFQTYSASLLSEIQYNGEISKIFITGDKNRSTNNYRDKIDNLNHYYEIVLKNQPGEDNVIHYFRQYC